MWIRTRACWAPKGGNAPEEYEDAFWPASHNRDARIFRAAVADGATETSFAGLWASMLVEAYGRGTLGVRRWDSAMAALQSRWRADVGRTPLPWYAEEKVRQGAFSTLVGLTLSERLDGGFRWQAIGVGDSCLFHLRDGELLSAFPLTVASAFNSRPYLLSSKPCPTVTTSKNVLRSRGTAEPGDVFLLMSDALACWILTESERGEQSWNDIRSAMQGPEYFANWVGAKRTSRDIRNDDVTVLSVEVRPLDVCDGMADTARL